MIRYETDCKIHDDSQRHGLKVSQIARALGLDTKTVAKWINVKSLTPRQSTPRRSKLDAYKDQMVRGLASHAYSATQIFQRLKEIGYDGGYSMVTDYGRIVRPKRQPAFLTLSFEAGEGVQMDWGEYGAVNVGSTRRRLSFFVMVLCDSRFMSVEFTVSQTMEHFLACHQHAFRFLGGVPKKVMVDNLKSAVLKRRVGQAPVFNPRYARFLKALWL